MAPTTPYKPDEIEPKWRARWEERGTNRTGGRPGRPKFYCLDMFPYPSGHGLHVGHWHSYIPSDIMSRFKRMRGYNVLHPMGWDAFGLPAENHALKTGIHPRISTEQNIAAFKRQLHDAGIMLDWDREIATTDPEFFKWTQWIFLKMFEKGLAYRKKMPINWCPSCRIGLANEEAAGGVCDRCGNPVTKKEVEQWMLRITAYADRLLADLDGLNWPERILKMQANWIGRSEGARVKFPVDGKNGDYIEVFTTRPDTLFGATFMVLAPEHKLVDTLTTDERRADVEAYRAAALKKSNIDRMAEAKVKTGVFSGGYAVNPASGERIQVWVADYVLADYGTGAIMCVPAHDERDWDFAKAFELPIREVVRPVAAGADSGNDGGDDSRNAGAGADAGAGTEFCHSGAGVLINSGPYSGMDWEEAKKRITADLAARGLAEATVQYKLRDWVFSRQRYWGEPIPIVHCERCGPAPLPESDLPLLLPEVESYQPSGTGESPLATILEWVNTTCPSCGGPARRETDTMPQWAGSSWYFLRFADPRNDRALASDEALRYWLPVDLYVGGAEHAVLHLLYARFFTMFLHDIGVVNFDEPFTRLFNQGIIHRNGARMSKSRGNVVNPDDLVASHGADALRLYEMFIGPPEDDAEWNDRGIEGTYRFLQRAWQVVVGQLESEPGPSDPDAAARLERERNAVIRDVTERMEGLRYNTVISRLMSYTNFLTDVGKDTPIDRASLETLTLLLAPLAPHVGEELWERLGHKKSVFDEDWPEWAEADLTPLLVEVPVQVDGKVRGTITLAASPAPTADEAVAKARANPAVVRYLEDRRIVRTIYQPGRILNLVTAPAAAVQ